MSVCVCFPLISMLSALKGMWSHSIFRRFFSGQSSFSQPAFTGIFTYHSFRIWKHSQRSCVQATFQIPRVLLQGWKRIHVWKVSQSSVRGNFVKFPDFFTKTRLVDGKFIVNWFTHSSAQLEKAPFTILNEILNLINAKTKWLVLIKR